MATPPSIPNPLPPPPPPPSAFGSSPKPSHPSWSSLMSDITMSEDEEGHQLQQNRPTNPTQQQHPRYHRTLVRNEDSAASLLEYSQSSEEAYSHKRDNTGTSSSGQLASAASGSTSFRYREEMNNSCRVVRFAATSSDDQGSTASSNNSHSRDCQQQMQAVEEGSSLMASKKDNGKHRRQQQKHKHQRHHSRDNVPTVNRETFLAKPNRWVTQLAYSFRTPPAAKSRKQRQAERKVELSQQPDSETGQPSAQEQRDDDKRKVTSHSNRSQQYATKTESTPLLPLKEEEDTATGAFVKQHHWHSVQHGHQKLFASSHLHRHPYDYISVAAAFLKDYEAARPPTLASIIASITPWHMGLYRLKYCTAYSLLMTSATVALFLSSALEGPSTTDSNIRMHTLSGLNLYALVIFGTDMWIRCQFHKASRAAQKTKSMATSSSARKLAGLPPIVVQTRTSQASLLTRPMCLFGLFLGLENVGWLFFQPDRTFVVLYSSIWKPIVLYYVSSQARHAMEALLRIASIVLRVLVIEMILILSFAAVACRLFSDFDSFDHLSVAWLSLFKLSTTVVNPSIWMPMYQSSHWSAVYFVLFIIVTVFYMHSLVLSVVFQTYIQAASEIHDRSLTDREDCLHLAFAALKKQHQLDKRKRQGQSQNTGSDDARAGIPMYLVREVLENLRPHYNAMKINALVEIFDTASANDVDYSTFRTKIRQALNASIRTARIASPLSMSIELTAVVVAVVNFIYVILLTSDFSAPWFDGIDLELGATITVAGLAELLMRTNPLRVPNFTPMTRFNAAFDGLAMIAAVSSCIGIGIAFTGDRNTAIQYVLMGRALDMIRVMRFFQIFRDVVRRSSDVLPAMLGPITLVVTLLHFFVYIGMAFWGGAIEVGELTEEEITPLYDMNNFNSYLEGLVTMFQILVVNDWHAIAEVFLYAKRCSSPNIVYPFFIIGNLIGVSILLNVITAFFVEAFVTKLTGTDDGPERAAGTSPSRDFSIRTSENTSSRRISASQRAQRMSQIADDDDFSDDHDADSEGSSESSYAFDVYEREGYDNIIQTVSGKSQSDDVARQVCNNLEIFESLTPGREKVGYLVCCQQTMNRYGNRRFESEAADIVGKMELHSLVNDMHGELLVLSSKETFDGRSLVRMVPHPSDPSLKLEISATILRRQPALSLFVSRIVTGSASASGS